MKKLLLCTAITALSTQVQAQTVDEIMVTGTLPVIVKPDPSIHMSTIETIAPTQAYTPGGYGGFTSNIERGTNATHTTVYRNGIPVNDAGTGWYDFSHDLTTGQETVSIVNGPNGALYGSGSLGGTVFIRDNLSDNVTARIGEEHTLISATALDAVNISYFNVNNGSVMTTNTEDDWYENVTGRLVLDNVKASFTDYTYDYDDCWSMNDNGNDCTQKGKRGSVTLHNDTVAVGYSFNDTEFYSDGLQTWNANAERAFADARDYVTDNILLGVTVSHESYLGNKQTLPAIYGSYEFSPSTSLSIRLTEDVPVLRFGTEIESFLVQVSSSYRNPTLYEKHGDAWVNENKDIKAEQGYGLEISRGPLTAFGYTFSEGINYNFTSNSYENTGSYSSWGLRYNDTLKMPFGNITLYGGYTNTPLDRVPKYKTRIGYEYAGFTVSYSGEYSRGTAEDISTVDIAYEYGPITLSIQDALDRKFEVAPQYTAGGRRIFLTFSKEY